MKKFLTLMTLFCMVICLSSCSKDDDDNNENPEIVGTWNVTHVWSDVKSDWNDVTGMGTDFIYATFSADGSYKGKMMEDSYTGSWKSSGKRITCNIKGFEVYYDIVEMKDNNAILEMRYQGDDEFIKMKAVRK